MIVLKSTAELRLVFNKLIKTLSVPVDWDGNFIISGNFLILPGKERSVIFNYDTRRVTTNLSDPALAKKTAVPIEKDSQLVNIFNLVLYAFGKWGTLKGITVEKDYKKINTLFGAVFGKFGVSAEYTEQHCFWYKDGTRISYEDAIQFAIESEKKKAEENEQDEAGGLWHSTVWKLEDSQFAFEKLSLAQRRKGRIGSNFYKVGYDCPNCGEKLYMGSFSRKEKPIVDTVEGRVQLARAFFCPTCVIFYTPLPDAGLEDGEAYVLDFDGDTAAGNDYMEMLGKLGTKEPNGEFNKYVDRVKLEEEEKPRENLNDVDKGIKDERKNLNGVDKGITDDRVDLNGIDKGIKDERRSLNGIDKGIKDERRSLNGIDKGITDDKRNLNGIDKGITDDKRSLNGIDKGIKDEKRNLNGVDKGIRDERKDINAVDKGIKDEHRNLNGVDKGIKDERKDLNGVDKGIKDDRRSLNGIDKGIKDDTKKRDEVDAAVDEKRENAAKEPERDSSLKNQVPKDYGKGGSLGRLKRTEADEQDEPREDEKDTFEVKIFSDIRNFFKSANPKSFFKNLFARNKKQDDVETEEKSAKQNKPRPQDMPRQQEKAEADEPAQRKITKTDDAAPKKSEPDFEKLAPQKAVEEYQVKKKEADELIESSEKSTRGDFVKLMDKIKSRHFPAQVEKEYLDKVHNDIAEFDKRRMDEACKDYLNYSGDELKDLYDRINSEDFLPEIKETALGNVSKRLWKIRNEEAELLVKRVKKGLEENGIAGNERLCFYPAREVLDGHEDALFMSRMECAKAAYAPRIGKFEYPIMMADITKKQNGKSGMFITPDAIYYGNFYTYGKIKADDIEKIEVEGRRFMGKKHIEVYLENGRKVRLPNVVAPDELEGYVQTLNDFVTYLKEKPFSRKEKYLAKESHDVICCFRCGYVYKNMKECPKCGYKFNV